VRALLAWLGCAALLAAAAGCSGGGKDAAPTKLSAGGFKDKVAAAITLGKGGLKGDPGFGLRVDVTKPNSLDTLTLRLGKPYAKYAANPGRLSAILSRLVQQTETSMKRGNADRTFAGARTQLMPLLKPGSAFRRLDTQPATTKFPGNLRVVYGVQLEDSFTAVTPADLQRWHVTLAEIDRLALANLARQTHATQKLLCEEKLCGWASGDGYDASRMLVPELRQEIVRKIGPAVYAVPRTSVFVALPIKLAARIRDQVTREFVTAPNPVSRDVFVERGGKLVVLPA
jgi:uncharacterized protein YtpQ (UPF0354 family)